MIIYGKNPVVEAIRNKRNISKMVVVEGLKDQNFLRFLKSTTNSVIPTITTIPPRI